MWRNPSAVSLAAVRRRVPAVAIAIATVTALAVLDAVSGHEMAVLGTLTAGPGIAAGSGRPRAVLAVGIYGLVLINVLSWWPDGTWGSSQHLLYTGVATAMTAVGVGIAVQIRAAQHALLEAEGHWRTLAAVVTHSDDAIVAAGLDGRLTAFNAGAERLYGCRAEDMVGTSIAEFGGGAIPEAARGPSPAEVLSRIAAGEKGIRFETIRGHKNGGSKDVSVVISPIYDERGTVVGVSSVARDISAQKRAEERSQQTQRMASLGQLAGGVAHDFNNLLGIMLSFITFAEESVAAPAVRADLGKARLAGERAVELTRQLLTFTRQNTVQRRNLDVNVCIAEAHAMLARTIEENIQLLAKPSAQPLTISADPGQIQQVLVNLAVNARDSMPDGGTLIIEATETELDDRQADLHPVPAAGRYVRLLVSDTGCGMSAEVASRVFEPFYTTKPKGHGTGLGLATVYGIIAEGGGSISVYSEQGIGTTVRVYFPLVTDAWRRPPAPRSRRPRRAGPDRAGRRGRAGPGRSGGQDPQTTAATGPCRPATGRTPSAWTRAGAATCCSPTSSCRRCPAASSPRRCWSAIPDCRCSTCRATATGCSVTSTSWTTRSRSSRSPSPRRICSAGSATMLAAVPALAHGAARQTGNAG